MNNEMYMLAVDAIAHAANMALASVQSAVADYQRYSILLRPKLMLDGDKWCALYGDNLQDGIAGFGSTPDEAMRDFDKSFYRKL